MTTLPTAPLPTLPLSFDLWRRIYNRIENACVTLHDQLIVLAMPMPADVSTAPYMLGQAEHRRQTIFNDADRLDGLLALASELQEQIDYREMESGLKALGVQLDLKLRLGDAMREIFEVSTSREMQEHVIKAALERFESNKGNLSEVHVAERRRMLADSLSVPVLGREDVEQAGLAIRRIAAAADYWTSEYQAKAATLSFSMVLPENLVELSQEFGISYPQVEDKVEVEGDADTEIEGESGAEAVPSLPAAE